MTWVIVSTATLCFALVVISRHEDRGIAVAEEGRSPKKVTPADPAAWGHDHIDKSLPEFVSGDECLFCHRKIGANWTKNPHQSTIRPVDAGSEAMKALANSESGAKSASEVEFVVGRSNRVRFLKSAEEYGKLAMLTSQWLPPGRRREGRLIDDRDPKWDVETFGKSCAGCHATAVDAQTHAFAAISLDCYVCHGDVPLEHSNQTSLVHLSKARNDEAHVVTSICAQCHVRTGKSRSSGAPFPNKFVAGDNLFRDFEVDLSDAHLAKLNPADRHVLENVRDVVVFGNSDVTCLSCHDVHQQSDKRHQTLARTAICMNCHDSQNFKKLKRYDVHSEICGY